jgi:hypothetical protein
LLLTKSITPGSRQVIMHDCGTAQRVIAYSPG